MRFKSVATIWLNFHQAKKAHLAQAVSKEVCAYQQGQHMLIVQQKSSALMTLICAAASARANLKAFTFDRKCNIKFPKHKVTPLAHY